MRLAPVLLALACGLGPTGCGDEAPLAGPSSGGLVFVRIVEGSGELWRVRLSDGAERAITETPGREEAWPYWSDPARLVVFEAGGRGETRTDDLHLFSPETGEETPLQQTRARKGWAAWAPSRAALVYAVRARGGATGVHLKDLSSGRVAVLARADADQSYLRPHFAPNGRRVVAQRRGDAGRGSHLWILTPGRQPRALTRDAAWFDLKGWFTRDGTQVVYSRRPAVGGPHEIAVVRADGSEVRRLDLPGDEQHSARPSPTRDEIAFVAARNGSFDLFVADLSGANARPLTDTPGWNEFAPRWSPDGERLVVTASPAEWDRPRLDDRESLAETRIRVLDRDGEALLDAPGMMPDWMPAWP